MLCLDERVFVSHSQGWGSVPPGVTSGTGEGSAEGPGRGGSALSPCPAGCEWLLPALGCSSGQHVWNNVTWEPQSLVSAVIPQILHFYRPAERISGFRSHTGQVHPVPGELSELSQPWQQCQGSPWVQDQEKWPVLVMMAGLGWFQAGAALVCDIAHGQGWV